MFVLFDAPSDLIAATFANLPSNVDRLVEFTASCPRCDGKQMVSRRAPALSAGTQPPRQTLMAYLRENLILDFQGDLTVRKMHELLVGDDSPEARGIMAKARDDRGVNDMMIVLADSLLEVVQNAINDDVLCEQLRIYAES